MHPAGSIILFTTASGAGYGLMFLALGADLLGLAPRGGMMLPVALGIGLVLVSVGLLSSLLHLGRPARAWRALSQWRSSWLSREGVAAIATYGPILAMLGYALAEPTAPLAARAAPGALAMAGCLVTIYCTAMIYASLRPVHAWHTPLVPLAYLVLGLMAGAVILFLLSHAFDGLLRAATAAVLVLLMLGALVKALYWRRAARSRSASTPGSALGLEGASRVRQWEAPHGHDNYLMKEMVYRLARERAALLRPVVFLAAFAAPTALVLAALFAAPVGALACGTLAVVATGLGLGIERWLFFAEAKHTVSLYYGAPSA